MIQRPCLATIMFSKPEDNFNDPIDHDKNFKELISTFFLEFLELFLPEIASTIDPGSIKLLQQEYFTDLVDGEKKIIDLLVEVK